MKVSRGISWVDERIVDTFAAANAPAIPQGVVDFTAGWGDGVSMGLTKKVRSISGTNGEVDCATPIYEFGNGLGKLHGYTLGGVGSIGAVSRVGQSFRVPPGMVRGTRWGRSDLKGGDWVMLGGKNRLNHIFSGTFRSAKYNTGSTYIVPKNTIVGAFKNRPINEPVVSSVLKQGSGIYKMQKIYKP